MYIFSLFFIQLTVGSCGIQQGRGVNLAQNMIILPLPLFLNNIFFLYSNNFLSFFIFLYASLLFITVVEADKPRDGGGVGQKNIYPLNLVKILTEFS